jgi:hypothetical protein
MFQLQDIIHKKDGYVVLRTCQGECAAQLRVCEKHFVVDHAQSLAQRIGRRSRLFAGWFSRSVWQTSKISGMTGINLFGQPIRPPSDRSGFDPMPCREYLWEWQWRPQVYMADH